MSIFNKLSEDWNGINEIIPYGFGWEASRCIDRLTRDFSIPFIIDNDPKKSGMSYKGIPICAWKDVKDHIDHRKIVVTTRHRQYYKISESLKTEGKVYGEDFCNIKEFVPEWYWKNKRECCLYTVDMTISAKCTFRCKNCNMFMPYYKTDIEYTLEELKDNIDQFFSVVDYVCYIGFIGGEPLLFTRLTELIEYIKERYSDQVGNFTIHTNGSVMPSQDLIEVIRKYNITVAISDYGEQSPCRDKMLETITRLKDYGIDPDVRSDLEWRDVGFPMNPNNYSDDEMKIHAQSCSADWRGINDGKFYYCNIAWSAEKAGLVMLEPGDYLVMEDLAKEKEVGKEKLLKLSEGYFDRGYMSFCRKCGGCGEDNTKLVIPGVQIS